MYWLAGLLEGEGSFYKGPPSRPNAPVISVEMTDEDIIERVSKLFGVGYNSSQRNPDKWKRAYRTKLIGVRAVELMKSIRPLMGKRRQAQIDKALNSHNRHSRYKLTGVQVAEIKLKLSRKESHTSIAKQFGVDRSTITHINSGRIWS